MEQQQTKLPLEWLSSRRTPELHRLEQLCRETAREHRCAQRRLQEVEEAMASEQEKSCPEALPAASGPTQLEQLSRKLNAANAELRRYETRMFAYERTMLALRKENAELTVRCEELRSELDKISTAPLRLDVPSTQPAVPLPETAAQTPPAADRQPKTKLERPRRRGPGRACEADAVALSGASRQLPQRGALGRPGNFLLPAGSSI
ncbi:MAG: hypothetical protein ACLVBX_02840 [Faecalibacterium prausnitzii]